MLLFKLPQGLRVPQKNLTVTPKWVCFFFFQTFLELATGGNVFFNEEKLLKNWFSFDQVKNSLPILGALQKIFLAIVLEVKGRYLPTIFFSFLSSLSLFENENFAAHAHRAQDKICRIFGIKLKKYT